MSKLRGLLCSVTATLAVASAPLRAQIASPTVTTIRGMAMDSLTMRPLQRARVEVGSSGQSAVTDARGAFRIDSVQIGPQRLVFSAPALDSIGLFGFAADMDVRANQPPIALATPSFATFHARLCAPSKTVTVDSAIVFGTVYDARTQGRVGNATVGLRWFAVDTVGGTRLTEPARDARSGEDGNYGMCGLPADLTLTTAVSTGGLSSGTTSLTIGRARILRRDFYVSDEMMRDSTGLQRGSGALRGVVVNERGQAMVGALILLDGYGNSTRTDSLGRWSLRNVPLGTQEISVRQLGSGVLVRTIDVLAETMPDEKFVMPDATVLSTVNVRGVEIPDRDQAGFLARRRRGFGYFAAGKDIAIRPDVAAVLRRFPGLQVSDGMAGLSLRSTRGYGCGSPEIVVDGIPSAVWGRATTIPTSDADAGAAPTPNLLLASLSPRDILGIEYYPSAGEAPAQFASGPPPRCGMLMVWTRASRW